MKPRILFVAHLPPPVHGVSMINQWILGSQALKDSFDFDVVNLTTARTIQDIGRSGFIKYVKFLIIFSRTFRFLVIHKYSVAYMTISPLGNAFIKDSLLVILLRLFRIKVIVHLHGKGIDNFLKKHHAYLSRYYNMIFKGSHVVHLSQLLTPDIKKIKSYKALTILNNGIPVEQYKSYPKEKNNKLTVLFLSNLIPSKGGMTILQSADLLANQGITNIVYQFVGEWGDKAYKDEFLDYIAQHNLANCVELTGPLHGEEKTTILHSADIFVLPTYYSNECFPLTLLEAMAAELPVISTYEGAIPEIVDEGITGFLVPAKNHEVLKEKLLELIQSEELRKQFGTAGYAKFLEKYTFTTFEKNLLSTFKEVMI